VERPGDTLVARDSSRIVRSLMVGSQVVATFAIGRVFACGKNGRVAEALIRDRDRPHARKQGRHEISRDMARSHLDEECGHVMIVDIARPCVTCRCPMQCAGGQVSCQLLVRCEIVRACTCDTQRAAKMARSVFTGSWCAVRRGGKVVQETVAQLKSTSRLDGRSIERQIGRLLERNSRAAACNSIAISSARTSQAMMNASVRDF
jgi:hypothetical protein